MEYREETEKSIVTCYAVTDVVVSNFVSHRNQRIDLLRHPDLGLMFFIDGEAQSSERDEHLYHCALVSLAMGRSVPSNVLIAGGGEGATLREVLKFDAVKSVTMVEWDRDIIELAKKHMTSWHRGSFEDSRATVITEDIVEFLKTTNDVFDVIILDLPDTFCVPVILPLLEKVKHGDTVVVFQAGPSNILQADRLERLRADTGMTIYSSEYVPFFQTPWAFAITKKNLALDANAVKHC